LDLEQRVSRLESWFRRQRLLSMARLAVTLFLLAGVAVYLVGLYNSMGEWRVEAAEPPRVGVAAVGVVRFDLPVRIYNPDGDVLASLIYYRVYVNGFYVGDGFIPYLELPSGWSEHVITVEVDVSRLGCGVARALGSGENLTVTLAGYASIELKAFGVIPWRTVTAPFNVTLGEAEAPQLDPATSAMLSLYVYLCENSDTILDILQGAGGLFPLPGGSDTQAPLRVEVLEVTGYPGGYTVKILVANEGAEPITVTAVKVNGVNALDAPITLAPGESTVIEANTPLPPALVEVESSAGTVRATP